MLLVDTNIWLVAADRRSDRHDEITRLLASDDDWASPTPVIAETAWLILARLGSEPHQGFLRLVIESQLRPIELTEPDWQRCLDLVTTYSDLRLDLADAALVAVAFGSCAPHTLNHRDFRVVRPAHCDAFELVPGQPTGSRSAVSNAAFTASNRIASRRSVSASSSFGKRWPYRSRVTVIEECPSRSWIAFGCALVPESSPGAA